MSDDDPDWMLYELQQHAAVVTALTLQGKEAEVAAYLDECRYTERLNAYKLARAAR
jgi:hypothetical protein